MSLELKGEGNLLKRRPVRHAAALSTGRVFCVFMKLMGANGNQTARFGWGLILPLRDGDGL